MVGGGVLGSLQMFFVLRWCVARQSSAEAYGGYDEVLHGFWGAYRISVQIYRFLPVSLEFKS